MKRDKMLPKKLSFVGVGAQKSGTTWIAGCLNEHPDICMPQLPDGEFIKELHYFNGDLRDDDSSLLRYFAHCKPSQVLGEYTPKYMYEPHALEAIRQHNPDVKLIICLRAPVDRAISQYRMTLRAAGQMSFSEAVQYSPDIVRRGFYFEQLSAIYEMFESENVWLGFYDDIVSNPGRIIQEIYQFLGVRAFAPPSLELSKNVGYEYVNARPQVDRLRARVRLILSSTGYLSSLRPVIKRFGGVWVDRFLYRMSASKKTPHVPSFNQERQMLHAIYLQDIEKTERLLNKDLAHWKVAP